jgi:hypothetical protein
VTTAKKRLDEIADCEFTGPNMALKIAHYAQISQEFAHDMARELSNSEQAAYRALRQLKGHPLLVGIDVKWRARRVTRVLREARELCEGISAECAGFNMQFRLEFADALSGKRVAKKKEYRGKVDL